MPMVKVQFVELGRCKGNWKAVTLDTKNLTMLPENHKTFTFKWIYFHRVIHSVLVSNLHQSLLHDGEEHHVPVMTSNAVHESSQPVISCDAWRKHHWLIYDLVYRCLTMEAATVSS